MSYSAYSFEFFLDHFILQAFICPYILLVKMRVKVYLMRHLPMFCLQSFMFQIFLAPIITLFVFVCPAILDLELKFFGGLHFSKSRMLQFFLNVEKQLLNSHLCNSACILERTESEELQLKGFSSDFRELSMFSSSSLRKDVFVSGVKTSPLRIVVSVCWISVENHRAKRLLKSFPFPFWVKDLYCLVDFFFPTMCLLFVGH